MKRETFNLLVSSILSISIHALLITTDKKSTSNKQHVISVQIHTQKTAGNNENNNKINKHLPDKNNNRKKSDPLPHEKESKFDEVHYYKQSELSEKPVILSSIDIDTVLGAINKYNNPVTINIFISENGDVDEITSEDSGLINEDFFLIKSAFTGSKFLPGKLNNRSVKSILTVLLSVNNSEKSDN